MGATLRHTAIAQRRQRREKRHKLRSRLAQAGAADKQGLEAKLLKTYKTLTAQSQAKI
jgi:hypothetical protein